MVSSRTRPEQFVNTSPKSTRDREPPVLYQPFLVPTDPKSEALFEQAASVEYANFYPFAFGPFHGEDH